MKIIVFGATGQAGSRIVNEAIQRGHEVSAVVRRVEKAKELSLAVQPIVRDVTDGDLTDVISGHDFVVTALRPPGGAEDEIVSLTALVVEPARSLGVPFLVVGGAAPLKVPEAEGHTVLTAPGFLPASVVPVAQASQAQFDWCTDRLRPNGSYLCPAAMFAPGRRRGTYRCGSDTLVVDASGESHISMEDFAIAVVDEVENSRHAGTHFTVGY